ncbi:MAG: haloalkane dehalogenase [Planctomycetota bacterium]|jgi:haloalkane dehalogenase
MASTGEILRTADKRFEGLPDFPFEPHYQEIRGLRIHYLDEGPPDARPALLLHGEPSWCYLYRHMIQPITAAGYRVVVPDLVGFGRSDKYARREDYSYQMQVEVMSELVERLDLRHATFFGQDWGGLVGLRVVAENPDRFDAVMVSNTALPEPGPDASPPLVFRLWRAFSRWSPVFPVGGILDRGTVRQLSQDVRAAYDAPFPTRRHLVGARAMPSLVPITADDPAVPANQKAGEGFRRWEKPFVTAFSDRDPITRSFDKPFLTQIPGARDQRHVTIRNAGHFVQEDKGEELGALMVELMGRRDGAQEDASP